MKHYTPEEIENNYEYKVVKRILKQEYPWIKDIKINDADLEKYKHVIFLEFYVDLDKIEEITGIEIPSSVRYLFNKWGEYRVFSMGNILGSYEAGKNITNAIEARIKRIHESDSIPHTMRMKDKTFGLGDFIAIKE